MRWPPHLVQYLRSLTGVFMNLPTNSAPFVTFTFSGFHKGKAFTGPADQNRLERQWQYPMAPGAPLTSTAPDPFKPDSVCFSVMPSLLLLRGSDGSLRWTAIAS